MSTVSSSSALLLVHLRSVALATQAAAVLLAGGVLGMQLPRAQGLRRQRVRHRAGSAHAPPHPAAQAGQAQRRPLKPARLPGITHR